MTCWDSLVPCIMLEWSEEPSQFLSFLWNLVRKSQLFLWLFCNFCLLLNSSAVLDSKSTSLS
jgi:hypothetical protein